MKWGVVVFPGSNCDRDCVDVLKDVLRQPVVMLWHPWIETLTGSLATPHRIGAAGV